MTSKQDLILGHIIEIKEKMGRMEGHLKALNGAVARHEKKNNEQDKDILSMSKSISGIKGKVGVVAGLIGAGIAALFSFIFGRIR